MLSFNVSYPSPEVVCAEFDCHACDAAEIIGVGFAALRRRRHAHIWTDRAGSEHHRKWIECAGALAWAAGIGGARTRTGGPDRRVTRGLRADVCGHRRRRADD